MFKRNVLAASLTLAALCSAQAAMADINGGGATLPQPPVSYTHLRAHET